MTPLAHSSTMVVKEADISKLKIGMLVMILAGLAHPAGAECWRWVKNSLPCDMDTNAWITMAFDEGLGQPVLLLDLLSSTAHQLWHYDGITWNKTWEGNIIPPYGGGYGIATGIYFDRVRNSLVLIGSVIYGQEHVSTIAFEYKDGDWRYIIEYNYSGYGAGLVYDTNRNRAVIYGVSFPYSAGFLEFDGYQFYAFQDSLSGQFQYGKSGYDPISNRVVYRGFYQYGSNDEKTFEYDGSAWTMVDTPHPLPGDYGEPGRILPFVPELGGLLAKPWYGSQLPDTWVYKDHDWHKLTLEMEIDSSFIFTEMAYDKIKSDVILFGILYDAPSGPITWEMRPYQHCRPLTKP